MCSASVWLSVRTGLERREFNEGTVAKKPNGCRQGWNLRKTVQEKSAPLCEIREGGGQASIGPEKTRPPHC